MARVTIRHFVTKKGRYHYWQPTKALRDQGWKPQRLADNRSQAIIEAERLNAQIDRWRGMGEPAQGRKPGTIAWLLHRYSTDEAFTKLSDSSKKAYRGVLTEFEHFCGDLVINSVTRQVVHQYRHRFAGRPHRGNQAMAVIQAVFRFAVEEGIAQANPAEKPRTYETRPRDQMWSIEEEQAFVHAAQRLGLPSMVLAIALGIYTAQRPIDIRKLPWSAYDGEWITLRQKKTGAEVWIPVLSPLRALLAQTQKRGTIMLLTEQGRPYGDSHMRVTFNRVMAEAGIKGLQFRDLRRTAVVRMAEQGVSVPQIAAITGHSIDRTGQIMETYLPRTRQMAAAAGAAMEAFYKDLGR